MTEPARNPTDADLEAAAMRLEKTLAEDPHHPDAATLRAALARYRLARRLAHRLAAGAVLACTVLAPPTAQGQEPADLPDYFANLPDMPPIVGEAVAWDGDTLHFAELDIRVRLHAVAAPEMSEWPWGPWARALVDDMIHGDPVTCRPTGDESHGRPIAVCGTDRINDIAYGLILVGLATEHRAYSGDGIVGDAYRFAEVIARDSAVGVWIGWPPMPPAVAD